MTGVETLLYHAEQFVSAVRKPLSPRVFRDYILCLEEEIRKLPDDLYEINLAFESLSQYDYADSTNMVFMNQVVIPEIEAFQAVIQEHANSTFVH